MAKLTHANLLKLRELIDSEGISALELIIPLADKETLIALELNHLGQRV